MDRKQTHCGSLMLQQSARDQAHLIASYLQRTAPDDVDIAFLTEHMNSLREYARLAHDTAERGISEFAGHSAAWKTRGFAFGEHKQGPYESAPDWNTR